MVVKYGLPTIFRRFIPTKFVAINLMRRGTPFGLLGGLKATNHDSYRPPQQTYPRGR